ncbi:hypothetical protein STSP_64770 [Streptomyces jeddahensis]|uniref:Uncharacterized protein n=1 Tax=Streptomyces jeddahensis TaxID=1716141 RepID=A0A177HH24_9ACTN|nr:hypothetical protein STSP_64770 [Streptomyces jeddahensis]
MVSDTNRETLQAMGGPRFRGTVSAAMAQRWRLYRRCETPSSRPPSVASAIIKKDIVSRIEHAVTQREWAERMAADAGPEEMPRN